ncbi:MAG: hypothetical protein JWP55_865, partial [Mycobacterium sp.]|nr:hypothetical protein [Mycobacterium sp.]
MRVAFVSGKIVTSVRNGLPTPAATGVLTPVATALPAYRGVHRLV